ncbi:MAG: hypothetical protein GEV28_39000 [Actinophytocola sp.]|uniref:hypothetical protein n=1 Tax=Actinophytocola sp. TaxID=1872138 RepID=UPI00132679D7|nr:hypothetical protein [Actinophytocola sp.]MPZ86041.1 hypothetical protein [Actinophytocola sp.]
MEFLSVAELEHISRLRAESRQTALESALRSTEPVRAELAQELAGGRVTARRALALPGYQELLERRTAEALAPDPTAADDPPPHDAEQDTAEPTGQPADTDDDEDFAQRNIMMRATPSVALPPQPVRRRRARG